MPLLGGGRIRRALLNVNVDFPSGVCFLGRMLTLQEGVAADIWVRTYAHVGSFRPNWHV